MPKRTSNPTYRANRAIILEGAPNCALCGRPGADTADHIIPHDAGGTDDLHNLRPAHQRCNSAAGARYLNNKRAQQQQARQRALAGKTENQNENPNFFTEQLLPPTPSSVLSETEPVRSGFRLAASEEGSSGLIAPRLVSAGGGYESFGGEVAEFSEAVMGRALFPWQQLAVEGQLQYRRDDRGRPVLLHRESLVSTARQNGKSVALTALIGWALTRWAAHRGEPVHVLSVANKLDRAVAIFTELAPYLEAMGAKVVWSYGRNKVTMPDGSTWEVRAAVPGLHGMSPTLIVVDELWNISQDTYFDALRPSQIAQWSPLMSSWSTAGDEGSAVMLRLREQALAAIDAGTESSLYFAEWSMPPGVNPDDPANWMWANPALGHTITVDGLKAAAETPDRGAFLRAHLNLWVSSANAWIPPGLWDDRRVDPITDSGGVLAVDAAVDESKYVGVRCRVAGDRVVASVEFVADSSFAMWREIEARLAADPKLQLAIGASLEIMTPEALRRRTTTWGYGELLKHTGLVLNMIREGRLVHTGEQMLAEHVNRAVLARAQGAVVLSSQKSPGPIECARAMVAAAAMCARPMRTGKASMGSAR